MKVWEKRRNWGTPSLMGRSQRPVRTEGTQGRGGKERGTGGRRHSVVERMSRVGASTKMLVFSLESVENGGAGWH